jgi:S1-C subfamily serine protease
MKTVAATLAISLGISLFPALEQEQAPKIPVSTQLTLDASAPVQRPAINSVLLMHCKKTQMKGTGFALSDGSVVTAAHVLCGCKVEDIVARTTQDRIITFSKLVRDEDRDIAAMRTSEPLHGGLELAPDSTTEIAERVNTWGFPLIYNGPAPLISVGYVSGYYEVHPPVNACDVPETDQTLKVIHVVVNAAFNPGNSGGPLFVFGQNKVVGLVIWKKIAFSDNVRVAVDGFSNARNVIGGNFSETMPDGTTRNISDQRMIGLVLGEFYNRVQVDIGEAVAASEVRKFLKKHTSELK